MWLIRVKDSGIRAWIRVFGRGLKIPKHVVNLVAEAHLVKLFLALIKVSNYSGNYKNWKYDS